MRYQNFLEDCLVVYNSCHKSRCQTNQASVEVEKRPRKGAVDAAREVARFCRAKVGAGPDETVALRQDDPRSIAVEPEPALGPLRKFDALRGIRWWTVRDGQDHHAEIARVVRHR